MEPPTLSYFVNEIKRLGKLAKPRRKKDFMMYQWVCQWCGELVEEMVTRDDLPYRPFCWHCRQFQEDASGNKAEHHDMDELSWKQFGFYRSFAADAKYGMPRISKTTGIHPDQVEDWYNMPRGSLGKRTGLYLTDKQKRKIRRQWNSGFKIPDPIV